MARRSRRACSAACSPAVVVITGDLMVAVEDVMDIGIAVVAVAAVRPLLSASSVMVVSVAGIWGDEEGECVSEEDERAGGDDDAWDEESAPLSLNTRASSSCAARSSSASIS